MMESPGEKSWLPSLQFPKSNFAVVEPSGYWKSTFTLKFPPEVLKRMMFLSACVMDADLATLSGCADAGVGWAAGAALG